MNTIRLLVCLCLAPLAWGATCTVASSGNFADLCADGDNVVLNNGVTLTIPAGTTAIAGAYSTSGGTAAIACATTTGTGTLVINGTLIYRGNVSGCNNITIGAGAVITHDNSLGVDQTYTDLVIGAGGNTVSSAAHPFVRTTDGGKYLNITGGTGCTVQKVYITDINSGTAVATTSASLGTVGSTCSGTLMAVYYFTPVITANRDSRLIVNGTAGSRVTFNIAAGATNSGGFAWTGNDTGLITGSYADVTDCGRPSGAAADGSGYRCISAFPTTKTFQIDHFTFRRSARVSTGSIGAGGTWIIDDSAFFGGYFWTTSKWSAVEFGYSVSTISVLPTTGTRRFHGNYMQDCDFFQGIPIAAGGTAAGLVFTNNVFLSTQTFITLTAAASAMGINGTAGQIVFSAPGEWSNNLFYTQNPDAPASQPGRNFPGGTVSRAYTLDDNTSDPGGGGTCSADQNYHPIFSGGRAPATYDQIIMEPQCASGFSSNGMMFEQGTNWGSGPYQVVVQNSISLPDGPGTGGYSPWAMYTGTSSCTNSGSSWCPQLTVHHSTWIAGYANESCGVGNESSGSKAGQYQGAYDNIVWLPASGRGCIQGSSATITPVANANAGTWDYNWRFNFDATDPYADYAKAAASFTNGAPGANDSTGDPQFNGKKKFLDWAKTINASDNTWADVFTNRYALRGTSAYDSRYDVTNLIDYVETQWAPTNAATATASSTGGQVGAVAYQAAGGSVVRRRLIQ